VIAASRPVNKNITTGTVITAKRGTEPGVHKLLANYQTGGYKLGQRESRTEESDHSLSFMNTVTKSTQA